MTKDTDAPTSTASSSMKWVVVFASLFIRVLVGYQHHSGEGNHHGSKVAWGGDYEAQRHWMELTLGLPIGDWYWYDLQYWGLDYPPLTAYVSYLCGVLSKWMVGEETVALYSSRGYEGDPTHKSFMRATVWLLDGLIYFPAAYCILRLLWDYRLSRNKSKDEFDYNFSSAYLLALLQPAVILIDHGHFQYNTVALGLALWGLYYMAHPNFYMNCIWGSVFFCGALNFKQMTLYYAPAIFAYLLGRSFAPISGSHDGKPLQRQCLERFAALGTTVIVSFGLLWWPFLVYGPSDENLFDFGTLGAIIHRGKHVLHRIFPLERGLFEGKVANLWCALDTKPFNIRDRIPDQIQPLAALALTVCLMLPSCIWLFLVGKQPEPTTSTKQQHASHVIALLWGTTSCALAFFLASFQVHEKSILLALAPASLLALEDAFFCDWFAVAAAWTLWPLLVVDRLQMAYACVITIFGVGVFLLRHTTSEEQEAVLWISRGWKVLCQLSFLAMLGLHALEKIVIVPSNLPDLFPVLWSVGGCALCCLAWAKSTGSLYLRAPVNLSKSKLD